MECVDVYLGAHFASFFHRMTHLTLFHEVIYPVR